MPPGVGETLPEACYSRKATSDENSTTTAKKIVEWNSKPASNESTT